MALGTAVMPAITKQQPTAGNSQIDYMPIITVMLLLKLSKTKEGLKVLDHLGKEFIRGIFSTLKSLGHASAANYISAWANPILVSGVLDRFGFLKPGFNKNYHLGLTVISGAKVYEEITEIAVGALPWSALKGPTPSDFPSNYNPVEGSYRETIDWSEYGLGEKPT